MNFSALFLLCGLHENEPLSLVVIGVEIEPLLRDHLGIDSGSLVSEWFVCKETPVVAVSVQGM